MSKNSIKLIKILIKVKFMKKHINNISKNLNNKY